jgi:glutamate synthase (NADPH) small chain
MGVVGAYLTVKREDENYQDIQERIKHFDEFTIALDVEKLKEQGSRCMECGIPFCHSACPLGNLIPDFNDAVANEDWELAAEYLFETNPFPEFTGRICPAPCEASCVLNINRDAVSIKQIEKRIIETAYENGYVAKNNAAASKYKVAIIGSGPAGLAAADKLSSLGHSVTVYEKDNKIGGLLRYGIPDFKLDKKVIDRRIELMMESGVEFVPSVEIGKDISINDLDNSFDAVLFAMGAQKPRDLQIEGRNLDGVHFAMEFLSSSNMYISGEIDKLKIDAKGKKVLVIGGGDTGSDCLGTSLRQGAKKVVQVDIIPEPQAERTASNPWPEYPKTIKVSSSQAEGGERKWSVLTKKFIGNSKLQAVEFRDIEWQQKDGRWEFKEVENSNRVEQFDLALIASGFISPITENAIEDSGVKLDNRQNIKANTDDFMTSRKKFFAAGDVRKGQSLVVWALSEGRDCAISIDNYLKSKE